jgi:glycosidase
MRHWSSESIFYHIYPLGLSGAPSKNDFCSQPASRLGALKPWIAHIRKLGANALYIGPLFESTSHGYDTVDYFTLDRRLGVNSDLKDFVDTCHAQHIRVIFDAVFHHVGRDHFAFRDVQHNGWNSPYREWFYTNFDRKSSYGDAFGYEGWNGHYSLVKLNLRNNAVKQYIFDAVAVWMDQFGADGLRLDAADAIELDFFNELHTFCKSKRNDFWLMGEVIHGDYRNWINPERLDSVTNYECYKGLWSSHNDGNYFEIEYALHRQFGDAGIYKHLPLYNFADNHDVDRVASVLTNPAYFYPLHILLFTMPGVPSVYYGSEWGITGKKEKGTDAPLRPAIDLLSFQPDRKQQNFYDAIQKLILLRRNLKVLRNGEYRSLFVKSRQFAFLRERGNSAAIIAVNSATEIVEIEFTVPFPDGTIFIDRLNNDERVQVHEGKMKLTLFPTWGRVLANAD